MSRPASSARALKKTDNLHSVQARLSLPEDVVLVVSDPGEQPPGVAAVVRRQLASVVALDLVAHALKELCAGVAKA